LLSRSYRRLEKFGCVAGLWLVVAASGRGLADRGAAALTRRGLYDLDLFAVLLNHVADVDDALIAGEAVALLV
jgi:hypothetical protein